MQLVLTYPQLSRDLQRKHGKGHDGVPVAEHAQRQQRARGPGVVLLRRHEQGEDDGPGAEQDGDHGVRPGHPRASDLQGEEHEHQERRQEGGADEVYLAESAGTSAAAAADAALGLLLGGGGGGGGILHWSLALAPGLDVWQGCPAEEDGEEEYGCLAYERPDILLVSPQLDSFERQGGVYIYIYMQEKRQNKAKNHLHPPADQIRQPTTQRPTHTPADNSHDVDVRVPGSHLADGDEVRDDQRHEDVGPRADGPGQEPPRDGGSHGPRGADDEAAEPEDGVAGHDHGLAAKHLAQLAKGGLRRRRGQHEAREQPARGLQGLEVRGDQRVRRHDYRRVCVGDEDGWMGFPAASDLILMKERRLGGGCSSAW